VALISDVSERENGTFGLGEFASAAPASWHASTGIT
jgi:hypothetical protein